MVGSSGFGQKPVFGAFGSNTTQPSPFRSTTQPSQPAFGSCIFGSTTRFGGSSQPAFGATTIPAFGDTSGPAFGATTTPAFGATPTPAFGSTTTPAFGATSSTPVFGATIILLAFGATSSPAFGSTESPTFGSTGPAFGMPSSSLFRFTGAFGASSTPAFGSSGSTVGTSSNSGFGASSAPGFGSTTQPSQLEFPSSIFGSSTPFGGSSQPAFGATTTPSFDGTSSPAFGATTTPAFGATSTFPAFGGTSSPPFGSTRIPTFGNTGSAFGYNPTQPSPFGSTTQPSFESSIVGSSTPFGGSSQPSFGATITPAFGGTSSSAFGAMTTPAYDATSTPAFGATRTPPAFGATSSPAFGSTTSPTFGSTGSAFGVSKSSLFGSTGALGTSSTPDFGSSGSTFGMSSNPAFGVSSAPGFGSSSTPPFSFSSAPAFGQSNSTFSSASSPFGAQSSPFGTQPTTLGSNAFGQSAVGGQQRGGSRVAAYAETPEPDGGGKLESISAMPVYKDKSHEELCWEDYQLGDKGSSGFGQKPVFGAFGSNTTQPSPFGSTTQPSQPAFGSGMFGSTTPFGGSSQPAFGSTTTPAFGGTSSPAFGATSTPAFGATSTPAFGATSTPAFGATSTPPAFGATSTPPAFGATSSPAFGSTTSPTFGSTGSAFGLSNSSLFGSTGAFGASSTPAFGSTGSTFGTSSNPGFGVSSATGFGSSSTPSFSFTSAPGFGQSNSTFGSASSQFGAQSSPFGAQPTALGNNAFGQSAFGGQQRGGSRVAAYAETPEPDGGSGATAAKLESISAMPVYKDKSHEELRWEDYQLGDKGGPAPAGGSGFGMSTSQPNTLNTAPSFPQASTSPFNTATSTNMFTPKTPSFTSTGFGTSSTPFSSSSFGLSTSSSIFQPSSSPSGFGQTSSPSLFSSSMPSTFSFSAPAQTSNSTFNTGMFNSTAPVAQTGSTFGLSTTSFGQNTAPFGQSNAFNAPSTGYGLGSSSTASATSNLLGFNQPTSSFPMAFQSPQPLQNSGFGFNSFNQTQPGNTGGLGGSAGILGQNNFGQLSATQSSAPVQPVPSTNPFGTLPAMPQMSIGRGGTAPSVQYGISSMPVVDRLAPVNRMSSSLVTSRHLTQRRVRLPVRKYYAKNDDQRFPFFIDDEETVNTPKADALFLPRENPRALVIRPKEQWPLKASAEKASPLKDTSTPVHENETPHEDGIVKERVNHVKVNQKPNGVHDDHSIQKGDSYMTLSGHRAGEAAIVYEHGPDIEALMPKLRRSDYYTEPRIQELAAKERAEPGFCCHVKDFVVGRVDYGSIKFFGETDVRRLDLESVVQFNNREVIVYMDDNKKPPVGQGLNKPAEVTLLNITCMDKKTGRRFTEGPKTEKYKQMLKKKAEDQGAEFVSYDPLKGEWKFRVSHFSEYKLGDEDDWDMDGAQDC